MHLRLFGHGTGPESATTLERRSGTIDGPFRDGSPRPKLLLQRSRLRDGRCATHWNFHSPGRTGRAPGVDATTTKARCTHGSPAARDDADTQTSDVDPWFTRFLNDRQTRKPSAHTMKAYRQDFVAIATLVTDG